jgi:hypothetical protein
MTDDHILNTLFEIAARLFAAFTTRKFNALMIRKSERHPASSIDRLSDDITDMGINHGHGDATMSILKNLKLATAARGNPAASEFGFRAKVLAYLAEQKALAEAEIAGTPFTATKKVTRKNVEGEDIRVDVPRNVRKGWFTDASGRMFFQIRYGSKPLEFAKGMNAVEVENLADVPVIIGSIIEAINAGELDPQLNAARDARRANFKPRTKKTA